MHKETSASRVRDYVLYVLIGLALLASGMIYVTYFSEHLVDPKWIGMSLSTLLTFGYPISWGRSSWPYWQFWSILGFLLGIHTVTYIFGLERVKQFPMLLFFLITVLEWNLISATVKWAGSRTGKWKKPRTKGTDL
jgi:ABC-type Fe3+-siderophore transport system permease subunit